MHITILTIKSAENFSNEDTWNHYIIANGIIIILNVTFNNDLKLICNFHNIIEFYNSVVAH